MINMAKVIVKDYNTFDAALKAFKKKCVNENILGELRDREFYMTRSQKKRKKKLAAERRAWIKKQRYLMYYSNNSR